MRVLELSGGVGGARMARGLAAVPGVELTVLVNVGDDEVVHGLHVSPDIDTVTYTLAHVEGSEGWGRAGDSFAVNTELARFGVDNRFRVGDLDLALNLYRTTCLAEGLSLSEATARVVRGFGLSTTVLPATDDRLRTMVLLESGWTSFQDYFVLRGNRDEVLELRYDGSEGCTPAPGAISAIESADHVVIAPSNPPLSIWPILAVPGIREAITEHGRVTAVSPLIGGKALKGPADRVMRALGLPSGNQGVVAAYEGLIDTIVIDSQDAGDAGMIEDVDVMVAGTRIGGLEEARRLAHELLSR
jgi:LPPG:FO 2-phospho-L-lactate transferase